MNEREYTDNENLRKLLFHLAKKCKLDMERRFLSAKVGITPFQYAALVVLNKQPATLNELARALLIQPPSLVPAVEQLAQAGLIEKSADISDRRKIQLTVTAEGKELLKKKLFEESGDKLNRAFNTLDKTKQNQLINLLEELNDKLI
jgi:DNA-binding MarR family transcriptional regulator